MSVLETTNATLKNKYPYKYELGPDGEYNIRWVDFGSEALQNSFFEEEVLRHVVGRSGLFVDAPMTSIMDWAQAAPVIEPNGFIFHISRCGSTLIGNLFRRHPEVLAHSEPKILSDLLTEINPQNRTFVMRMYQGIVNALSQPRREAERHFVIKQSSFDTCYAPLIAEAYPNTPRILVYRDPIEVLISNYDGMQSWLSIPKDLGFSQVQMFEEHTILENAVYALKAAFKAFLDSYNEHCLVINHNQFSEPAYRELLAWFKVPVTDGQFNQIMQESTKNSKGRGRKFTGDSAKKQERATPKMRALVEEHLYPLYEQLEAKRLSL